MQKKLLAAAIAASIGMPAVSVAQGPTIYGQANLSIDYLSNDDDDSIGASSNTSRFGVKGAFDLGGGLSAIYLFEWGVFVTDAASSGAGLSRRNQIAGFKHDVYGSLVVGRHDTPGKVVGRKADLFWSQQLGTNRSFTDLHDGSGLGTGFDFRADNVIGYISPNWGPFHIFAAYVTDHKVRRPSVGVNGLQPAAGGGTRAFQITDNNDFDAYSVAGLYEQKNVLSGNDDLYLGVSYEQHNIKFDPGVATAGLEDNEAALRVAGTYAPGNWKFALFYQMGTDQGFVSGADRNQLGGGLAYTMGPNTFKGQVYWLDELDDTTILGSGKDTGGLLYAVGWDHAFSKNVQFYVQGAAISADKNATNLRLGGSGHGDSALATPDETTFGASVGTRIKF
jgi:predicted porin